MNHIDKINISIEGKVAGKSLHIESFELVVAVNTIPAIVLNILPIEPPEKGAGSNITASAPDITDITKLYTELSAAAVTLKETATIKIKIENVTGDVNAEKDQNVELKDWILTDVGLSSVSASDSPVLSVTFCHPVVKLDKTGMIYENIDNSSKKSTVFYDTSGAEVISYMDSLYQTYSGDISLKFYDIGNEHNGGPDSKYFKKVSKFRKDLNEYKPGKYIEGKCKQYFLKSLVPELEGKIRIATGEILAPKAFCNSTWRKIISTLCPAFLTHVIPTYDKEKLLLEPCSPWQKSTYSLSVKVISSLDIVPIDPNPIIGTAFSKEVTGPHVTNGSAREFCETDEDTTYYFYFPKKALEDDSIGEILNIGESNAIVHIIEADIASNATYGQDDKKGENIQQSGNSVKEEDRLAMGDAYLEAMFLINYRKNCKSSISATPIFKDSNGEMIYPGRVLSVVDQHQRVLYYGYITRMLIKGSTSGGGVAAIELSHSRPSDQEGDRDLYVDEGTENPCYPAIHNE